MTYETGSSLYRGPQLFSPEVSGDRPDLAATRWERLFEAPLCLAIIVFLAPLLLLLALLIKATDGGPILFGQVRIGKDGRPFRCLKFRSMAVDAEQRLALILREDPSAREEWLRDHKLRRDPRITELGRFLRKSSLDELPQLFNVLNGEMSLVGPRPIVAAEIQRYGRHFSDYCSVRPGLTGLWQVSGRNAVSYRRRVALDRVYARRRGVGLYLRILLATVPALLSQRGAS